MSPFFSSQVFWLMNGVRIDVHTEINYIISSEGNLIINQARLSDMGNYTCGAQNVASRRLSDSAILTVYGRFRLKHFNDGVIVSCDSFAYKYL